jgi:hypothetical protein
MSNRYRRAWRIAAATAIASGVLAATGCDMTPRPIEKTVKEAGTTDEQVDKVMQDFKER